MSKFSRVFIPSYILIGYAAGFMNCIIRKNRVYHKHLMKAENYNFIDEAGMHVLAVCEEAGVFLLTGMLWPFLALRFANKEYYKNSHTYPN